MPPTEKTYEEHVHYLHEIVKLKLWFLWRWLREHPGEEFSFALRERVDIYRKTDVNPDHLNPKELHYDAPAWLEMEGRARGVYEECHGDADPSRFERLAFEVFRPSIDARSRRDYEQECAGVYKANYQCGSLRYDLPRPERPNVANFHIANSVRPHSIFDDPRHLPDCFHRLMEETEARFGADTLATGTWLNSHPKWLALFPEDWHRNMAPAVREVRWHYGFWGQFLSGRGTFNERLGQQLRATGELPYGQRSSWCSFRAMREHLASTF